MIIQWCFFFNDTATTEIYTLSLHDALPISSSITRCRRKLSLKERLGPFRIPRTVAQKGGCRSRGRLRRRDRPYLRDRKSTRLNSSHANISYAVFCLKKKKNRPLD